MKTTTGGKESRDLNQKNLEAFPDVAADDCRLHVFEMRNLPPETRERFRSDMRIVVDYLAEGNGFRSDQLVVHKEALVRLLRALGGDRDVEDTVLMLEEMNIREEELDAAAAQHCPA